MPLLDTATLEALLAQHDERGDAVTVLTTTLADPTGYGRVIREADGTVAAVVEQASAKRVEALSSSGRSEDSAVATPAG